MDSPHSYIYPPSYFKRGIGGVKILYAICVFARNIGAIKKGSTWRGVEKVGKMIMYTIFEIWEASLKFPRKSFSEDTRQFLLNPVPSPLAGEG